ncbi:MAG TPA: serine/threonine-protein kinase [Gemmatimonadales bacterium]|nr:serine/threonine-protein kinase [Gemmatimonadales bacterium]
MNAAQWSRLEAILDEALERPPQERKALIEAACGDDAALLAEARRLAGALEPAAGFLDRPLRDYTPDLVDGCLEEGDEPTPALPVEAIGPYRLIREIGRGGMGAVYLAERSDGQYDKKVAIKLVPPGPDAARLGRRFAAERRMLASLEHPHIAHLLDGGVSAQGLPYLVMEYVEGERIDTWCDARRLTIRERLSLCNDVAEAVQFAHQHLIVHRDLKPGNILVTAEGQVKLLDFGIAKLMADEPSLPDAPLTATGAILATPEYASPEQIRGGPVSTASDVYSLGVLLYELLAGRRPYALAGRSREELARAVCEQTPESPSTAPARAGAVPDAAGIAAARGTTPDGLRRALAGDLDTIVLAALRKEPALRYASVQHLRDDLRRHLDGFPVLARPATRRYRAAKFLRRNRGKVAAGGLVAVAILAGLAGTTWQARAASRQAERAERVRTFLTGIFAISDPDTARGRTVTARELLDRGAAELGAGLEKDPEVRGEMLGVVGILYQKLGLYPQARPLLEQAVAVQRSRGRPARLDLAVAKDGLASLLYDQGEFEEAERVAREGLAELGHLPARDPRLAGSISTLANVVRERGRLVEADSLHREGLRLDRARGDTAAVATSLANLAAVLWRRGKNDEARNAAQESVSLRRALYGDQHTETASALRGLGIVLTNQGEFDQAERALSEALAIDERLLGKDHPQVASILGDLGMAYWRHGKHDEARAARERALAINRAALGPRHPEVATGLNNLATTAYSEGRYGEAVSLFEEALAIWRESLGDTHPHVLSGLNNLGAALREAGELPKAEPVLREVLQLRRGALGEDHPDVAQSHNNLAYLLYLEDKPAEAEPGFRRALAGWRKALGADHPNVAFALGGLGQTLLRLGRTEEARAALQESLDIRLARMDTTGTEVAAARRDLGISLARLGRYDEAEALLLASYPVLFARYGAGNRLVRVAREGMAELGRLRGRPVAVPVVGASGRD